MCIHEGWSVFNKLLWNTNISLESGKLTPICVIQVCAARMPLDIANYIYLAGHMKTAQFLSLWITKNHKLPRSYYLLQVPFLPVTY